MTETLLLAAILIPCLVIAIVFHEVAHGLAARALGDPTAQELGRLSLNPIRHVDPVGTIFLPGALALAGLPVFGWAKPVPVNARRLSNPRFGMMAVAAAGPGTNFLLAALGAVALGLLAPEGPGLLAVGLISFISINVFLGLFNLLPIPPFDGSHIVEGLLPRRAAALYARARPLGMVLVLALLVLAPWLAETFGLPSPGIVENFVLPPVDWAMARFMALAGWIAGG